jgi:hypothetical protein
MFKATGSSGRRNSGSGGYAQASGRIVSPRNKFKSTQYNLGVAFQGRPGDPGSHGFDSNSSRVNERS